MKSGNLPSRDESETNIDYNHETNKIMVEINGEREELSVIDSIALVCKLTAMIEVVLRNNE